MAKNGKKWLKMAKIEGKILGSNIYLCKKNYTSQLCQHHLLSGPLENHPHHYRHQHDYQKRAG